jgi:hypothetical protein
MMGSAETIDEWNPQAGIGFGRATLTGGEW